MTADVVVVGGGAAGTATALALHRLGASVIVVDRSIPHPVLAEGLPPRATPLLRDLGLWTDFLASGQRPLYGNRSTWGSQNSMDTDFIRSPHGTGWRLDRPAFDRLLIHALDTHHIGRMDRTRLLHVERGSATHWSLIASRCGVRTRLGADVLIDASGRSRQVSRLLGVPGLAYDRLIGMIGIFASNADVTEHASITEIEAVPDGWWYASLLPDGRLLAGYMTDVDNPTATIAGRRDGWLVLLRRAYRLSEWARKQGYNLTGSVRRVAANSSRPATATGAGWCAVGDAGAAHDPLSSHGIVSALETGRRAAEAIAGSAGGGLAAYDEFLKDSYARYLAEWLSYYALEVRWSQQEFWQRRHQALHDILSEDPRRSGSIS